MPTALGSRVPALLRHGQRLAPRAKPLSGMAFSTRPANPAIGACSRTAQSKFAQKRLFTVTAASRQSQPAPSANAYLQNLPESIVKTPAADIKKVLVVGSGGLAIGQAGEFDYSGT